MARLLLLAGLVGAGGVPGSLAVMLPVRQAAYPGEVAPNSSQLLGAARLESFDRAAAQVARSITDFAKWRSLWREMAEANQRRVNESFEEGASLVLGVFSVSSATEHQEVIRETWMRQRGVCNLMGEWRKERSRHGKGKRRWRWLGVPRRGCSVYAAFVMGRLGNSSREPLRDGLYLDIKENMNLGKTMAFFRFAARKFPWATQIAKVDMDAFPHVHKIVANLYGREKPCSAKYEYWGVKFGTLACHHNRRNFADYCPDDSCAKKLPCADQMDGGLYGLSRDLALAATEPGGHWAIEPEGAEDAITGARLHEWARTHRQCVSMWMMADSHYHTTYLGPHVKTPGSGPQSKNLTVEKFYWPPFWGGNRAWVPGNK